MKYVFTKAQIIAFLTLLATCYLPLWASNNEQMTPNQMIEELKNIESKGVSAPDPELSNMTETFYNNFTKLNNKDRLTILKDPSTPNNLDHLLSGYNFSCQRNFLSLDQIKAMFKGIETDLVTNESLAFHDGSEKLFLAEYLLKTTERTTLKPYLFDLIVECHKDNKTADKIVAQSLRFMDPKDAVAILGSKENSWNHSLKFIESVAGKNVGLTCYFMDIIKKDGSAELLHEALETLADTCFSDDNLKKDEAEPLRTYFWETIVQKSEYLARTNVSYFPCDNNFYNWLIEKFKQQLDTELKNIATARAFLNKTEADKSIATKVITELALDQASLVLNALGNNEHKAMVELICNSKAREDGKIQMLETLFKGINDSAIKSTLLSAKNNIFFYQQELETWFYQRVTTRTERFINSCKAACWFVRWPLIHFLLESGAIYGLTKLRATHNLASAWWNLTFPATQLACFSLIQLPYLRTLFSKANINRGVREGGPIGKILRRPQLLKTPENLLSTALTLGRFVTTAMLCTANEQTMRGRISTAIGSLWFSYVMNSLAVAGGRG